MSLTTVEHLNIYIMKHFSLVLALLLSIAVFAQKKEHHKPKFTKEQKIQLHLKKLTVALDLTGKQADKIKPIVAKMVTEKEARKAERKARKEEPKRMSADEAFKKQMDCLDEEAKLHQKMKSILDKDQYWAWKMIHAKHKKNKKGMKKNKRKKKHNKEERRGMEE